MDETAHLTTKFISFVVENNVMYKFDKNAHSVYTLNYHLVQCIKYRKKILGNEKIVEELKSRTQNIATAYGVKILSMEPDMDHVHILFTAKPQTPLIKFINNWKSSTAKAIKNRYPELEKILWNGKFWSDSYCLITTGQTTLEQVRQYVENQGDLK